MTGKLICWDSTCFIDWLHGKTGKNPERLPRIQSIFRSVESGGNRLAVSVLVYAEVLESRMPPAAMKTFRAFMKESAKVEVAMVDVRIAETAMKIRSYAPKKIEPADAVHIATAVVLGAHTLNTNDTRMLSLHKHELVNGLRIAQC